MTMYFISWFSNTLSGRLFPPAWCIVNSGIPNHCVTLYALPIASHQITSGLVINVYKLVFRGFFSVQCTYISVKPGSVPDWYSFTFWHDLQEMHTIPLLAWPKYTMYTALCMYICMFLKTIPSMYHIIILKSSYIPITMVQDYPQLGGFPVYFSSIFYHKNYMHLSAQYMLLL